MVKIKNLTKAQEKKMYEVKEFWLDYIFSCKNSINKKQAEKSINWLYKLCGYKEPIIIYTDSPFACQMATWYIKELHEDLNSNVWSNVRSNVESNVESNVRSNVESNVESNVLSNVWSNVWYNVRSNVLSNVLSNVRSNVWSNVESNVWYNVRSNVLSNVRSNVEKNYYGYECFSSYGNISDYGWVSFYDFFTQIGVINNNNFNQFKNILTSGIYDMIQLEGYCIVCGLPKHINRNSDGKLHSENTSAIKFNDGYEIYYWNGVEIPSEWILDKKSITKNTIINEKNIEKKRCLQEILGNKFIELLDVKEIDCDIDLQKNKMLLYKSKEKDELIDEYIYYLSVICPSTNRKYNICVPECKNVWEAKAWTFNNKKIQYRHGDVGLLNLKKEHANPILES